MPCWRCCIKPHPCNLTSTSVISFCSHVFSAIKCVHARTVHTRLSFFLAAPPPYFLWSCIESLGTRLSSGMIKLCAYVQHGYVFSHISLYTYICHQNRMFSASPLENFLLNVWTSPIWLKRIPCTFRIISVIQIYSLIRTTSRPKRFRWPRMYCISLTSQTF